VEQNLGQSEAEVMCGQCQEGVDGTDGDHLSIGFFVENTFVMRILDETIRQQHSLYGVKP
jgi:hypothetical protein